METKAPDDKPTTRDVWMRGLFMLLFIIGFGLGLWLLELPRDSAIYLASRRARAQPVYRPLRQLTFHLAR